MWTFGAEHLTAGQRPLGAQLILVPTLSTTWGWGGAREGGTLGGGAREAARGGDTLTTETRGVGTFGV